MTTADLLSRLKGVRSNGTGFTALCPGHNDTNPSLSITEVDGKILLKCFAGCDLSNILQSLNLEPKDLFLDGRKTKPEQREIVAIYHYIDANGKPFEVVRTIPKGFYQRQPDGKGGYLNHLKGITPTLYHQDKLKQMIDSGTPVYVVEGEKDTDRLRGLGLVATCNPMGAGKWHDSYSQALKGADLVIIPDNDQPGRDHAGQVAKSCHGMVKRVRVLELPGDNKSDVSDWLDNGGDVAQLKELAEACPDYEPTPDTSRDKKDKTDEMEVKQASFLILGNYLIEQVHFDGESKFVVYDCTTDKYEIATHVMQGEIKIIPRQGEEISVGAVRLPSGLTEYGDTLSLLKEIESHVCRYLDVTPAFQKFAAYYVLLSWVFDRFNTLPYLRALGDTGTGKSRFLDVCGGICYKPIMASGCITPAPIYRMLNRWNGTIILDEADLKNSDEYNEVVTILNCGFERGRPVIRALRDNPDKLQFLPTFGPKVFATRRRFKDPALEARCLTEIMQETTRGDIPPTLTGTFYKEQEALRNKLLLFRLKNYVRINPEEAIELALDGIEPRLKQISACFASLFAGQPAILADYRDFIGNHQRELVEQRATTVVGQVVEQLFALTVSHVVVTVVTGVTAETLIPISSKEIAEPLGMTPQVVGQILKTLGLQMRVAKIEGKPKRCIIYDRVKLDTLKKRYIPCENEEVAVTAVTAVTGYRQTLSNEGTDTVDDRPPGIPCAKGAGGCSQRTDSSKPFSCVYEAEGCKFRHVANSTKRNDDVSQT